MSDGLQVQEKKKQRTTKKAPSSKAKSPASSGRKKTQTKKKSFFSGLFGKKKAKVSAPKGGHAMLPGEKGSAVSAREMIEAVERNRHLSEDKQEKLKKNPDKLFGKGLKPLADPELVAKHTSKIAVHSGTELIELGDSLTIVKRFPAGKTKSGAPFQFTTTGQVDDFYLFDSGGKSYAVAKGAVGKAGWKKVSDVQPLFAGDPGPDDVKQGGLGDCYLEAAIASLVKQDPGFVKNMFVDHGTKVSVRLFDIDMSDKDNPTFTKRKVVVGKSAAKLGSSALYDQGALWVQILEKAYAAAGFSGTAKKEETRGTGGEAKMANIAGGHAHFAAMHLTGRPGKREKISSGSGKYLGNDEVPWNTAQQKLWKQARKDDDPYSELLVYHWFAKSPGGKLGPRWSRNMTDNFFEWVTKNYAEFRKIWVKAGTQGESEYKGEVRYEDIEGFFQANGGQQYWGVLDPHVKKLYPGKRGTGKYSADQDTAWERITAAIDAKRVVGLSSNKKVARGEAEGVGHSGGESKAKGLVGGHAYTVLDYAPRDSSAGVRKLLVRNPWGKFGRKFEGGKAKSDDAGEFWLDLADVTKRFHSVDIT